MITICPTCLDFVYWDKHAANHCHVMRIEMEEYGFRTGINSPVMHRMVRLHETWFLVDHHLNYEDF